VKHSETDIFEKAVEAWGADAQAMMLFEEMGELIQVVCKLNRNHNGATLKDLAEELADVELMLDQTKHIYCIEGRVEVWRKKKLERLEKFLWPDGLKGGRR
jgi:NTP pyrophosphatase (non-canonical NTP hydrolase)